MSDPASIPSPHLRRRKLIEEPAPKPTDDPVLDAEAAFESVEQVVGDLAKSVEELEADPTPESPAPEQAEDTHVSAEPGEPDTGDELADQIQALLDEDAASFQSPEELLGETYEAPAAEPTASEAEAEPPSIGDVDAMLAEDADDALQGDFESVDTLLHGAEAEEPHAVEPEPTDEPATATASDHDAVDDDLAGAFETPAEVVGEPEPQSEPVEPPADVAEQAPVEDDLAGTFESIDDLDDTPTQDADEDDPLAGGTFEAIDETPQDQEDDAVMGGTFEAVEEDEPEPEQPEDQSVFASAEDDPVEQEAQPTTEDKPNTFTLTLPRLSLAGLDWSKLVALLRRINDVLLWVCGIVNKPMNRLPGDIQKSIGWAAIAVVVPGFFVLLYGLFLA